MEEQIIDVFNEDTQPQQVVYATFWKRVGAAFLDGLIVAPFNYGLTFVSMVYYKVYVLAVLSGLIHLAYKVYMEKKYGQTLGKMAMKIKVINNEFQPLDNSQTWKRNYYYVVSAVFSLIITMNVFNMQEFYTADTYMELMQVMGTQNAVYKYLQYAFSILFFIDIVFMRNDDRKRTLHDRLGNTVVIQQ